MRTQSVRALRRVLAGVALLLGLALAAMALPSAATASSIPPPKTPVANQVEMVRSGGVTGVPVTFTVDAEHFGEDGARLMRLVSTPEFLALKPVYGPTNPCCDFFEYTVTVTYNGGNTKTVFTSEVAENVPEILINVIQLTERIGSSGAES
jgi:hypothetical protein